MQTVLAIDKSAQGVVNTNVERSPAGWIRLPVVGFGTPIANPAGRFP